MTTSTVRPDSKFSKAHNRGDTDRPSINLTGAADPADDKVRLNALQVAHHFLDVIIAQTVRVLAQHGVLEACRKQHGAALELC